MTHRNYMEIVNPVGDVEDCKSHWEYYSGHLHKNRSWKYYLGHMNKGSRENLENAGHKIEVLSKIK